MGPCTAKITLEKLEDIRGAKRRKVVSRAISILKGWEEEIAPGAEEIKGAVTRASKKSIIKYGSEKLPAGPDLSSSDEIIIVEGRADIITLMKSGISNTIAVEGTHVPKSIAELTKQKGKTVIAFLDGDRGGDLILRELMQVADVDYIARAPKGKEVENLTRHEVTKALQAKIPAEQALELVRKRGSSRRKTSSKKSTRTKRVDSRRDRTPSRKESETRKKRTTRKRTPDVDGVFIEKAKEIKETFQAILYNEEKEIVGRCGVADLAQSLETSDGVSTVVFDGVVTQRLVDIASGKKIDLLVAAAVADLEKKPRNIEIVTFEDLG
ncbi:MAG: DNA primase DnaG [Candidatus Thorarchaeota archaeon]|nr:MAG: DNA primase DnaG [Candidatus Thorarchaeota archaeon]